jgi:hypothetical protein
VHESGNAQEGDDLMLTDDRKYVELGFVKIFLEFFNFHMSMKRELSSLLKVKWLLRNLLPTFNEMRFALENYYVHEDVSNLSVYQLYRTLSCTS